RQDLERVRSLYPSGSSDAEYDAARAADAQSEGDVRAARARLKTLQDGTRAEDLAEARAELDRARAQYELVLEGARAEEITAAEARASELKARLVEIEVNLKEAVVTAPEKAVVEVVSVRRGDVVSAGQAVVRVLRADDLWVKVFVPETELGKVRLNQKVSVTIDAYPGRFFEGTVQQVAAISEF